MSAFSTSALTPEHKLPNNNSRETDKKSNNNTVVENVEPSVKSVEQGSIHVQECTVSLNEAFPPNQRNVDQHQQTISMSTFDNRNQAGIDKYSTRIY